MSVQGSLFVKFDGLSLYSDSSSDEEDENLFMDNEKNYDYPSYLPNFWEGLAILTGTSKLLKPQSRVVTNDSGMPAQIVKWDPKKDLGTTFLRYGTIAAITSGFGIALIKLIADACSKKLGPHSPSKKEISSAATSNDCESYTEIEMTEILTHKNEEVYQSIGMKSEASPTTPLAFLTDSDHERWLHDINPALNNPNELRGTAQEHFEKAKQALKDAIQHAANAGGTIVYPPTFVNELANAIDNFKTAAKEYNIGTALEHLERNLQSIQSGLPADELRDLMSQDLGIQNDSGMFKGYSDRD